jgi:hypothetical protein
MNGHHDAAVAYHKIISACSISKGGFLMGRLIVDGNMVYEIDEECLKKRTPPDECGVQKELEKQRRGSSLDGKRRSAAFGTDPDGNGV